MHIVLFPSWYKSPERPVLGTFFEEQARMLMRTGNKSAIFYPVFRTFSERFEKGMEKEPSGFVDNGLPTYYHYRHALMPRERRLNYNYFCRTAAQKFRKHIKDYGKPDVLHAHSAFFGGVVANYISRAFDIPYVITEHLCALITHPLPKPETAYLKKIYNEAETCIVVGNQYKGELMERYGFSDDTFTVVPNVVSPLFLKNLRSIPAPKPFKFFTNSYLIPRKNHKLLFNAFKMVLERHPDSILRVGGDGDILEELKQYVVDLGLENSISFLQMLQRDEVKRELDDCNAFAFASEYETFGVVLIEALAAGRPVVTLDSGGPKDIMTSPNVGILVEQHDARHLSDAMIEVIENYNQYDASTISKYCEDNFSETIIEDRLMDIYSKSV